MGIVCTYITFYWNTKLFYTILILYLDSKWWKYGFISKVIIFVTYQQIIKFEYCYVAITTSQCRISNETTLKRGIFFQVSHNTKKYPFFIKWSFSRQDPPIKDICMWCCLLQGTFFNHPLEENDRYSYISNNTLWMNLLFLRTCFSGNMKFYSCFIYNMIDLTYKIYIPWTYQEVLDRVFVWVVLGLQHTVCRRYGNFFLLCSVYKLWISPINNEK